MLNSTFNGVDVLLIAVVIVAAAFTRFAARKNAEQAVAREEVNG